jgi:signal transduction histidine kinase
VTLASDQQPDRDNLSDTSRKVIELREATLAEWEKRVRASVKEATTLGHPILINTFPTFYDNIAQALTPDYPRVTAIDATTIATEHGSERARLTRYPPQAIIQEYQEFRWALLDVLHQHGVSLEPEELWTINASIDSAIRESVTAFSLMHTALREQFVAALTHDLRGPLAAANMAAELIAHSAPSAQTKELAGRILVNHKRVDQMIQDLLNAMVFQGGGRLPLDLSEFDIMEVVREVRDQFNAAHPPGVQATGAAARVYWDRQAVRRALENLVGNAIKYGAPDRPITIKSDAMHGRLLLTVHNEGNPIPPERLEDVFQIFWRALSGKAREHTGWGIGLPYVRGVAESHGGSAGVDSTAERGTTFHIDMPLDARPFEGAQRVGP